MSDVLALALDREIMAIARRACGTGGVQARGTGLACRETALPRPLFAKLEQRMAATAGHAAQAGNSGAGSRELSRPSRDGCVTHVAVGPAHRRGNGFHGLLESNQ